MGFFSVVDDDDEKVFNADEKVFRETLLRIQHITVRKLYEGNN